MRAYLTTTVGAFLLIACARGEPDAMTDTTRVDSPASTTMSGSGSATATVRDATGRELGTLTLTDTTGGIAISGRLVGLAPGEHGMHLHTIGRCDPPTFESAGSHWNPTSRQHGTENPQGPHFGDLPNVSAGSDSIAVVQAAITRGGSLRGAPDMLLDADAATVIIHSARDDYRTDPSGGTGGRVACGVVTGM